MAKKIDFGVRLRIAFRNVRFPATASAIEGRIGHSLQGPFRHTESTGAGPRQLPRKYSIDT